MGGGKTVSIRLVFSGCYDNNFVGCPGAPSCGNTVTQPGMKKLAEGEDEAEEK